MDSMQSKETKPAPRTPPRAPRRVEYVASIVVNIVLLLIANQLLKWDILPFLTQDFSRVLWLINISLGATILVNLGFIFYDGKWFKSLCRLILSCIALAATIRMWQVFPFDFSAYSGFDWALLVRIIIIFTIAGTSIGILVELVKLGLALGQRD